MKKALLILRTTRGFTLVELIITVAVLVILTGIAALSYETLTARARYSKVAADMDGIAHAGYADYTNNLGVWDVAPNPWTPPPNVSQLLDKWPVPSCPGYYYSWDNGAIFGLDVVRVSLRREADEAAVWSYCVNSFGGGNCDATDIYGGTPIEITNSDISHFYCNE